jgi:hypothetical protein
LEDRRELQPHGHVNYLEDRRELQPHGHVNGKVIRANQEFFNHTGGQNMDHARGGWHLMVPYTHGRCDETKTNKSNRVRLEYPIP